jgi:TRAP-type C4-dicarboxylate transport system permease small subunit
VKTLNDFFMMICKSLIILMVPVMTIVVFLQVVLRYIFLAPLPWVEEFSKYLLIWISTLGSAYAIRHGLHISVVFLNKRIQGHAKSGITLLIHSLAVSFFAVCLVEGISLASRQSNQLSPALQVPMTWPLLAIPVGFGFMILFTLEILIEDIKKIASGGIATGFLDRFQESDPQPL